MWWNGPLSRSVPGPVRHAMSVTVGLAAPGPAGLHVVIAEDAVLLREGLHLVLTDAGPEVAGADIAQFTAIRRVAAGESVIDLDVVSRLVARPRRDSP
jgi:hypothetical protein